MAFAASLIFTLIYGRIAATYKWAEKIMIPAIDILQSVPVLGFLSVTVIAFMSLFPNSLLGVEMASIFAIFTGQVWNMTFSFYHSLTTLPRELQEAAKINKLGAWSRFTTLEVPYSMIGLVWNSMMSFGGGWFFLAASESITVLNQSIRLPGIGSYMALAIQEGNTHAVLYAIITMVIMILLVDQLFWRPIVSWSQKFKIESSGTATQTTSWVLQMIRRARYLQTFVRVVRIFINDTIIQFRRQSPKPAVLKVQQQSKLFTNISQLFKWVILGVLLTFTSYYAYEGALELSKLPTSEWLRAPWLGFLTLLRVLTATVLGMLWAIPVGVQIGFHPKIARIAQPTVQILASFPANMTFPFLTVLYLHLGVNMQWGAIPLMMLGTQWYILFNVIAGAMAIPTDLREAAKILRLTRWGTWKKLIFPGIFPYLVTGAVTASGGAWNASIIAEVVTWQDVTLRSTGLGSYITDATTKGNWPEITWGIMVMVIFVVFLNRLVWRKLYQLAESKYHLE